MEDVMDYVTHTCKNCECAFVAEDYTNCRDVPPHWRLCPECAKAAGVDYAKQKPWQNYSEKRKMALEALKKKGKENLQKYNQQK